MNFIIAYLLTLINAKNGAKRISRGGLEWPWWIHRSKLANCPRHVGSASAIGARFFASRLAGKPKDGAFAPRFRSPASSRQALGELFATRQSSEPSCFRSGGLDANSETF
jgi:hypothetical protein